MRKIIIAIAIAAALAGCEKAAESSTKAGAFDVELLFTHDGCSVYRFSDGGYSHYYTDCRGSTSSTTRCGKSCQRPDEIPTIGREP